MRPVREWGWVPSGFSALTDRSDRSERSDRSDRANPSDQTHRVALIRDDLRAWYEGGGLGDPERRLREEPSAGRRREGRGTVVRIAPGSSGSGPALVLKKYRRGGAMAGMLPDVFLGFDRMAAELAALERARSRSVPSARAAALILDSVGGPLWRGYMLTEEIAGSMTLDRALGGPGPALELAMRAVLAVRALHDAGIVHRDLNLRNLLVKDEEVFLIDLDGASLPGIVTAAQRFENLSRLDRSYCRLFSSAGPLSSADRRSLLRAYSQGDAQMQAALENGIASHLRRVAWHRMLWRRT